MASSWITTRPTKGGEKRYRVEFRLGGRESRTQYGGSFKTKREAGERKRWIAGELAARRVPDLGSLEAATRAPTLPVAAEAWRASRLDVVEQTGNMHRWAVARIFKVTPALHAKRI